MLKILIPALNEERNIESTIEGFKKIFPNAVIVVCNNNSSDNTAENAEKAGAKVIYESRKGKGYAIRRLLKEKADIYVIVDGDDAFYAEDAEKMISLIENKKADMVIGVRKNLNEHNRQNKIVRKITKGMLNYIFRRKYDPDIKDFLSGYRALNYKLAKNLNLNSKGFEIETELTIQALKNQAQIKEIDVHCKKRRYGRQKSSIFNVGFPVLKQLFKK